MEGCSNTSSCEDTPMQNEDSITVTAASNQSSSNSVTFASSNILNNQGLTIYRSPNLPPTHYILLKSPLVGGNLTAENCLIVDVSQLQQQNLTFVPSVTQQVAPPLEEQDSKERVQNYIRNLNIPGTSSTQAGVVTADDEQTSQQQQFSQSGSLNDRVIFGQVDASAACTAQQQQSATGGVNVTNSISEAAKLVNAQLSSSVVYDQQQQCKQQQQSLECSENGVLLESTGGGGPSNIPQGAIMTTNVSMVNVLASSSSAVISPSCSSSSPSAAVAQQLLGASLSSVSSGPGVSGCGVPASLQSVLASTLQNHLTSFPTSIVMSNPPITNSAGGVIDLQEYRTPNIHGSVSVSVGGGGSGNGGTGMSGGVGYNSGVGGGVASYSNVTSPSAYTSPSEEDEQMDNSNDLLSSDNEDISDINRSLIHSGNLERHPNGSSGQNSGTATPGGGSSSLANSGGGVAADFAWPHLQQLNMANGLGGDLPTMVTKDASGMSGDSLEGSSAVTTITGGNDVTTISSDSFSDSGVMNGLSSKCPSSSNTATSTNHHSLHNNNNSYQQHQPPQQTQPRQKRPFDSSSAVAMYSRHTLIQHFPQSQEGVSLEVVNQPESRHRPRYLTEGSRGSVKDRTGNGYPAVRLSGFAQCPLTLQVFIGTDTGRPKPHGFFQACRVTGRNVISCLERNIDGTQIMEIDLDPKNDMRADIDCVGILKLRNSDVEAMESTTRSKKKSQRARMVFRVTVPKADGTSFTLQTMSETIQCSQPTGQPEIARLTADRSPACGGGITYILGKHFTRPTVTFSRRGQPIGSSSSVIPGGAGGLLANQTPSSVTQEDACWSEVADLLPDCISQHYLGCRIPAYPEVAINRPVYCEVTVTNGDNKVSDPAVFVYMPNEVLQEVSTLEAILSLPTAPLNQCPIMTIPTPAIAPSDLNNPQSIMTSTCSVSLSNNVMSSSVAASYSGGTSAKRSRTSQPENEVVMDQSPGSGSGGAGGGGGGPVASDSNSSLNTKMGPSTVIANPPNQPAVTQSIPGTFPHGAYSNVPIQTLHLTPALQQSLGFNLNSVAAAAANPCSISGTSKPVPTVVHASGSQDPNSRLQFLTQPPVFQIPQQMALKSTPVQAGFSQQMLTNVSFANVGAVSSVNSSVFIKPESESSCGVKSNGGSCSQPIVMPRGLITHVPPAQSVLPHGPNLGNVSNFKIQQNVLPAASIIGTSGPSNVAFNDVTSGTPTLQQNQISQQQIMSAQSATNVGQSGSNVPMDISKAPIAAAQAQPQQTQQNPPSDSPLTNSVLQNIVKSEDSSSSQQVALNFPASSDSNTPDLNSIIKGLLLIGANSPNPSTYAEFVIQLVQHYHKDVGKNESSASVGTGSNPASVVAQPSVTSSQLDATPPPQSQMSLGGGTNSNPSSVNQMNYNSPGSSQQQQQQQQSVNIPQHQIQPMQQQQQQLHSQQIQQAPVIVNSTAQQFSQVLEQGSTSQSFESKLPSSQTAQLTVAAIAKNPDLAPFAPMLIDAVEALQKQQQPNFNTDQLLNLIEQEALKLANIAGSQQQHQQAQNQVTFSGQNQQQVLQNQQVNQNQHMAQNQQIGQMSQQNSPQVTTQQNTAPQFNNVEQIAAQSLQQQNQQQQQQQQQMVSSPPNQVFQQQQQQQHQTQQGQQTYVVDGQQQIQHQAPPPLVRHPSQPAPTQQTPQQNQPHLSMQPCAQQNQSMSQSQQHQLNGNVAPPVNAVDVMQQPSAIQNQQSQQQQQQMAGSNPMFYQIQTSVASVGAPSVAPQQQAQFQQQSVMNQQVQQQQQQPVQQQQSFIQQQQVQQQTAQNVITQQTPAPQNQQIPTISINQQQQQQAMYNAQQQQQQSPFQQVYYKPATNEFQSQRDQMQTTMVPQGIDQPPPSVNSAPPPSVASGPPPSVAPSSVLSAPDLNTTTPAPALQAQSSASMGNVQGFNQQQQQQPQQANTLQQQSNSSYVVFSQAQNVQHPMYYQIAQKVAPEMHSSNMDLTDPELYTTQQTPHKHSNPSQTDVEEHMFKEPYPVDNSQNLEWQHQQQQQTQQQQQQRQGSNMGNVQYVSQSVNDLQQHALMSQSQQQQQQLNMSWEANSNVGRAPSQSSMNWESSSSSNNSGNTGASGMHHHPIPMKSCTTDPFLSSGSLETNQVQKVSSMMEIHSTFEHDQNSQGSSISSNDFHEFDSMFSQIAQSPLCTILNNDSLLTPSPAPPMTPEEPPARGAAVLKYLIEKGFIEGEQRNLVTAENIESAICSLSNQKPITEITFEDVVSVIAGTRST